MEREIHAGAPSVVLGQLHAAAFMSMYTCLVLLGVLLAYMIVRSGSASHAAAGEIAADDSLANGRRSLRAAARCGVVAVTARCMARTPLLWVCCAVATAAVAAVAVAAVAAAAGFVWLP